MFHTDLAAVIAVVVFIGVPFTGFWLIGRRVDRVPSLKRRFTVPQRGPADGTGVDARSGLTDSAALLPRSPQTPTGVVAPRPTAPVGPVASTGPQSPAGAADIFADTAPAGLHRRPVIIHER